MKARSIRIASVQFQHKNGKRTYNLSVVETFVKKAAMNKVQLIVFPEMCLTGYGFLNKLTKEELIELSEDINDSKSISLIKDLSIKLNIIIGVGLLERTKELELFNSYIVCKPDGNMSVHRKIQTFESKYISSGNDYTIIDTKLGIKLGVLICYDNNIIENCRITALKGADILLSPSQVGGSLSKSPHALGLIPVELWENRLNDPLKLLKEMQGPKGREWLLRWLPSRAHDNGYFVVFSNGVGRDEDEIRTGNAMIIDPYGRIIKEARTYKDKMIIADIDLSLLDMCTGRRWIRARRVELYKDLITPIGNEMDTRSLHSAEKI